MSFLGVEINTATVVLNVKDDARVGQKKMACQSLSIVHIPVLYYDIMSKANAATPSD